jgi:hypothetical protein
LHIRAHSNGVERPRERLTKVTCVLGAITIKIAQQKKSRLGSGVWGNPENDSGIASFAAAVC